MSHMLVGLWVDLQGKNKEDSVQCTRTRRTMYGLNNKVSVHLADSLFISSPLYSNSTAKKNDRFPINMLVLMLNTEACIAMTSCKQG